VFAKRSFLRKSAPPLHSRHKGTAVNHGHAERFGTQACHTRHKPEIAKYRRVQKWLSLEVPKFPSSEVGDEGDREGGRVGKGRG